MSGAELARAFHDDVVEPLLRQGFPTVPLVVGRFGSGSDVLGLDDDVSADHDWGLRLTVLTTAPGVGEFLEARLPAEFAGHPVRFATTWEPSVRHRVEVSTPQEFVTARLGVGPEEPWSAPDWLTFTGQSVLELVAGPVFTDDEGAWSRLRARLAWYPDDVWRYAVACCWKQLEQELPFVGRTGSRGDDLGSRVIAARLVEVVVKCGLLLDRVWAPYAKWVGTTFARSTSGRVLPELSACLAATDWPTREAALCTALEGLRTRQVEVGLAVAPTATEPFHDRGFRGVPESATEVLLAGIEDPRVRALPVGVGAVGQWIDAVDVLVRSDLRRAAAAVLRP